MFYVSKYIVVKTDKSPNQGEEKSKNPYHTYHSNNLLVKGLVTKRIHTVYIQIKVKLSV